MRPGGFIDGIQTDILYGQLQDGATVLSGTGIVGADGWLVSVPKPTHWWIGRPGASTLNDGASVNPLNLTPYVSAVYTTDQFNRANRGFVVTYGGGLYYNGFHDDLNDIGNTFTIIWEFVCPSNLTTYPIGLGTINDAGNNYAYTIYIDGGVSTIGFRTFDGVIATYFVGINTLVAGRRYKAVYTQSGTTGVLYLNGAFESTAVMSVPIKSTVYHFSFGQLAGGGFWTGTSYGFAVLKGTAWTLANVQADWAAWSTVDEVNTYARWYAATPTLTKVVRGITTSPELGTWGAEAAGQYGYSAGGFRYHKVAGDTPGSPGLWL